MSKEALDPGVQKAINAILVTINSQRSHQGKDFGNKSKWATIRSHGDYNIQIIPKYTNRKRSNSRGINATVREVDTALRLLRNTESFDDYIRVNYNGNDIELFDRGNGVPSDITFD